MQAKNNTNTSQHDDQSDNSAATLADDQIVKHIFGDNITWEEKDTSLVITLHGKKRIM